MQPAPKAGLAGEAEESRWFPWRSRGARSALGATLRVYCWPHAGGAASAYLAWARSTAHPEFEFVPVEPPGRGRRYHEELLTSMGVLVEGFLDVLGRRPADEPFALLGHSMGGLIAYEVARRLAEAGARQPRGLIVAGARSPASPPEQFLLELSDEALLRAMAELGGTPPDLLQHEDLMRRARVILRADFSLLAGYRAVPRATALPVPILALSGFEDGFAGPSWGDQWQALTSERFRHRSFDGSHFFVHDRRDEIIDEIATWFGELGASRQAS